jgi:hypothetical protein
MPVFRVKNVDASIAYYLEALGSNCDGVRATDLPASRETSAPSS